MLKTLGKQCTLRELSILLPAFDKVANAFDATPSAANVALKSKVLNDIISSLPRLKEPMKDILKNINLQKVAQGDKTSIWTDWDKHPEIEDAKMVYFNMVVYMIHLIYSTGAASD